MMLIYERCRLSLLLPLSVYINILSNFNTLKILTLFVHAGLFWCFHNPPNSDNWHGLQDFERAGQKSETSKQAPSQKTATSALRYCCSRNSYAVCSNLFCYFLSLKRIMQQNMSEIAYRQIVDWVHSYEETINAVACLSAWGFGSPPSEKLECSAPA